MMFKEIEFKYRADNISLIDFTDFCVKQGPASTIIASGYDHFYEKSDDSGSFCRLRVGPDSNQLTFKRKTQDNNNFVRTEHNIDLTPETTREQIEALLAEFGYKYNTSLFKNCFVYKYDNYTGVYYIVYDTSMKELGRFVELEMSETYGWSSEDEAYGQLVLIEKLCKSVGISPQCRVKRSLFELYKK